MFEIKNIKPLNWSWNKDKAPQLNAQLTEVYSNINFTHLGSVGTRGLNIYLNNVTNDYLVASLIPTPSELLFRKFPIFETLELLIQNYEEEYQKEIQSYIDLLTVAEFKHNIGKHYILEHPLIGNLHYFDVEDSNFTALGKRQGVLMSDHTRTLALSLHRTEYANFRDAKRALNALVFNKFKEDYLL